MLTKLLALSLFTLPAHAEKITECIPMGLRDGKVQIYALCNARAVNEQWNLKLRTPGGCAVDGQTVVADGRTGEVLQQGSFSRELKEGGRPALRACGAEEAITFRSE